MKELFRKLICIVSLKHSIDWFWKICLLLSPQNHEIDVVSPIVSYRCFSNHRPMLHASQSVKRARSHPEQHIRRANLWQISIKWGKATAAFREPAIKTEWIFLLWFLCTFIGATPAHFSARTFSSAATEQKTTEGRFDSCRKLTHGNRKQDAEGKTYFPIHSIAFIFFWTICMGVNLCVNCWLVDIVRYDHVNTTRKKTWLLNLVIYILNIIAMPGHSRSRKLQSRQNNALLCLLI